jgi:hypothetical protein
MLSFATVVLLLIAIALLGVAKRRRSKAAFAPGAVGTTDVAGPGGRGH